MKALALITVSGVLAVVVSGCGGGPSASPGVASLGGGTTTTGSTATGGSSPSSTSKSDAAFAFSRCMRSHGVPNFPDPQSGGGDISINGGRGLDPNSPQFQSAQRACQKLLPKGKPMSPAEQAKMQGKLLKFSACMRSHGVPSFPDPQFSQGGARLMIGPESHIDPRSPQFERAQNFCKQYLPGGGKGMQSRSAGGGPGKGPQSGSASTGGG